MFRCENCGKLTKAGEKSYKVIVETRPKKYKVDFVKIIKKHRPGRGWRRKKIRIKKVTEGWEIVKEIRVCEECYKKLKKEGKDEERSLD